MNYVSHTAKWISAIFHHLVGIILADDLTLSQRCVKCLRLVACVLRRQKVRLYVRMLRFSVGARRTLCNNDRVLVGESFATTI